MENTFDVISVLKEDVCIQGNPIKAHKLYQDLSDMNVSEQCISDYSNSLHNLLKIKGKEEAEKKVLTIFRINPLAAVRMIESCSIVEDVSLLEYSIKPVFSVLRGDFEDVHFIINDKKIPYVTLLIEAVFQNSITWRPEMVLEYAKQEDLKLHSKGIKVKYLNAYNMKHILRNIPENRQIEFINWFWSKHCYAARTFGKVTSFDGSRVSIIMQNISEGTIWRQLENVANEDLSDRELRIINHEKEEIRQFIRDVFDEGRHMEYVGKIIGKDDFYNKLDLLMEDTCFSTQYSSLCQRQRAYEAEEENAKERERELKEKQILLGKRHSAYAKLVSDVRSSYRNCSPEENFQWHMLDDSKNAQINLWTYWQGMNFKDVKIMLLGFDWGSVNDNNAEMEECLKKIQIMMKGAPSKHIRYSSCSYKKTDSSLEKLFDRCFDRQIYKYHYEDLFFSNLYLGYRKNTNTSITEEMALEDIKKYMVGELSIVAPKTIFCLGEKVYRLFLSGLEQMKIEQGESIEYEMYKKTSIVCEGNPMIVYCLPHCGVAGLKAMNLTKQLHVWKLVKQDMEINHITV